MFITIIENNDKHDFSCKHDVFYQTVIINDNQEI